MLELDGEGRTLGIYYSRNMNNRGPIVWPFDDDDGNVMMMTTTMMMMGDVRLETDRDVKGSTG